MAASELAWVTRALERYEPRLLRYAGARVGPELCRDVVQERFLKLCKQRREDVEGDLAAWLFTVCRNAAVSLRRHRARHTDIEEGSVEGSEAEPSLSLERKEAEARLLAALGCLTARQREIVTL